MATHTGSSPQPTSVLIRAFISLAVALAIMILLLFGPAGTLDWPRAWWFLAIFAVAMVGAVLYVWRANPELFVVRRRFQEGSKGWDVVVSSIAIVLLFLIIPVAGLDAGRFRWSQVPDWLVWIGYLFFFIGFALTLWAQAVNRHFELAVRIQTDRGHKVIDTGPYAIIRHPGYIGAVLLGTGIAMALGSLWALVPVVLVKLVLLYRTAREDATLQAELTGYADYARRVRYRWMPGVW
jgi:protein-S-isoprenylcysteine O-methyltransferase Ste14